MEEVREAKRSVVIGVLIHGHKGPKGVSFYGVDSLFTPVEEEDTDGKLDKGHHLRELGDKSVIANPLTTSSYFKCVTYACRKHHIYRVGGIYAPYEWRLRIDDPRLFRKSCDVSNSVQCWNSLRPDKGWHHHSVMHQSRYNPHVLFMDSKVYVVGGIATLMNGNKDFIFMETMMSRRSGWVALENPPHQFDLDPLNFVSAAWQEEGKLIFGSASCAHFFAYTPASSSWDCCNNLPFDPLLVNCGLPGVVVGGHCLWLVPQLRTRLVGLNLSNGKYFLLNLAIEGILPSANCWHYTPRLISPGEENNNSNNEVTLVWMDKTTFKVRGEPGASDVEAVSTGEEEDDQASSESSSDEGSDEDEEEERRKEEEAKAIWMKKLESRRCESLEKKEKRAANAYAGYHLVEFTIDFARAQKKGSLKKIRRSSSYSSYGARATGCLTVTSRKKLIAPGSGGLIDASFVMDVALPKYTDDNSSSSELGGSVLSKCRKNEQLSTVLRGCENKKVVLPEESSLSCKRRK